MKNILVTGGRSGLGLEICKALDTQGANAIPYDIEDGLDVRDPDYAFLHECDSIYGPFDALVNCAGINKIGWLEKFSSEDWDKVMDVNAKGIFMMTQALLPHLKETKGTVLNIVSNAAHMPMRCSAAYNASKGAALILTKQLARELSGDGITVFSVSPNKLSGTGMSRSIDEQVCTTRGWTMEEAQQYQLAGLLLKEETPTANVAEFIAFLLSKKERNKYLAGCDLPYGL